MYASRHCRLDAVNLSVPECITSDENKDELFDNYQTYKFEFEEQNSSGNSTFSLDLDPKASGVQYLRIRMYPYHKNLSHPFETGKMIWLDK